MTMTEENSEVTEDEIETTDVDDTSDTEDTGEEPTSTRGKSKDRDFSKVRVLHEELAAYINAHSGLDPITANQVKAVLYLRPDFNNSPEQATKREERKARKAEAEAKYAGMTDDQKKRAKQAEKAQAQANRYADRAAKAQAE